MKSHWEKYHSKKQIIDEQSLKDAFKVTGYAPAKKLVTFLPPDRPSSSQDFELVHDTFIEPKMTIREGVIRTLQMQLDPNLFKCE
jgi:hypothetical protein